MTNNYLRFLQRQLVSFLNSRIMQRVVIHVIRYYMDYGVKITWLTGA